MSIRIAGPTGTPAIPRVAPPSPTTPSSRFGDLVEQTRAANRPAPPTPLPTAPHPSILGDVTRQLLSRVARGERYVESVVRQGLSGRTFTPADLLTMQAQVYRYSQELDLVSKLVDRATSTVKTVLQQNG